MATNRKARRDRQHRELLAEITRLDSRLPSDKKAALERTLGSRTARDYAEDRRSPRLLKALRDTVSKEEEFYTALAHLQWLLDVNDLNRRR